MLVLVSITAFFLSINSYKDGLLYSQSNNSTEKQKQEIRDYQHAQALYEAHIRYYESMLRGYEYCVSGYNKLVNMKHVSGLGPLSELCGEPPKLPSPPPQPPGQPPGEPSQALVSSGEQRKQDRLKTQQNLTAESDVLLFTAGNQTANQTERETRMQNDTTNGTSFIIEPSNVDNATEVAAPLIEDLRIIFSTFIVPGTFVDGSYELRKSNTFNQDETIELYLEFVGISNNPSVDEFNMTHYSRDFTATFVIVDKEGEEIISPSLEELDSHYSETTVRQVSRMSSVLTYQPGYPPELDSGAYDMKATITDNLSGDKVDVVKEIIIKGTKEENGGHLADQGSIGPPTAPTLAPEEEPFTNANATSDCPSAAGLSEEGDFRVINDTFIVPGSQNGTFDVYEERKTNVFKPNEEIDLYVKYAGITQKPVIEGDCVIHYLTNTTGNFTVADKKRNIMNTTKSSLSPFDSQTLDTRIPDGLGSYTFYYYPGYPPLSPGDYMINYNLTDNLSGEQMEIAKDIVIEGEKGDFHIINDSFIVPGSANGTYSIYQPRESPIFKPNDTIEYYIELGGMNQSRILDNISSNDSRYLTNISAVLVITDDEGNVKASPSYNEGFGHFKIKYTDSWSNNNSYVFSFDPVSPLLETGNYIMNFTITDNLSGNTTSIAKDIAIEGYEEQESNETSNTGPTNTGVTAEPGGVDEILVGGLSNIFGPESPQIPKDISFGQTSYLVNTSSFVSPPISASWK